MAALDIVHRVPRLLIIHHSPTPSVRSLTEAVIAGANDDAIEGVEVVVRAALEANAEDVMSADGYVLGTPANFGYMSGALKHFFDCLFLEIGGSLSDDGSAAGTASSPVKPFGLYVHGRYDTTGAVRSVLSITGALPWRQCAATLEILGDVGDNETGEAYELGGTLAALLSTGG